MQIAFAICIFLCPIVGLRNGNQRLPECSKKQQSQFVISVFLSICYSTCHWCHVMAHESFEDNETAEILNKHFISIKVDREERPDIDSVYMFVCQAFIGSGG